MVGNNQTELNQSPKHIMHKEQSSKFRWPKFRWLRHLRHPFAVPVAVFMVLFFTAIISFIFINGHVLGAQDSRIVELNINGRQQVIPTTAPTVGDLLNRLNITLNPGDEVVPSTSTQILQNNFQINIYRAHPVTVVENNQKVVIQTASNDPRVIAKEAGFTIYPQDYVTQNPNVNNLSVLGEEVIINPSTPVQLNLYGNQVTIRTHATTVGQLLSDEKIQTGKGNNVLPSLTTPITANMQILVVPVGQKLVATQQPIPFTVQQNPDPSLTFGTNSVAQAGVDGLELVVTDATTNQQLQQVIVTQPTPEIINVGTAVPATASGNNIDWLKSSDINPADYNYVDYIMTHESHWNPSDVSYNGCVGLGQSCGYPPPLEGACPDWQGDPVCQLDFFNAYSGRYGGWAGAYAHEVNYGWW